jgi:hypothetical protein
MAIQRSKARGRTQKPKCERPKQLCLHTLRLLALAQPTSMATTPEAEIKHLKGELAYVKLQRDALLRITWLDLPDEPSESTAKWQELFNEGWVRRRTETDRLETLTKALEEARDELTYASNFFRTVGYLKTHDRLNAALARIEALIKPEEKEKQPGDSVSPSDA